MPYTCRHDVLGFQLHQTVTLVAMMTIGGNDEGTEHCLRGAVVALSLGLASVGTGMGLTASHGNATIWSNSASAITSGLSTVNVSAYPSLICAPEVNRGRSQAKELLTSRTFGEKILVFWLVTGWSYRDLIAVGVELDFSLVGLWLSDRSQLTLQFYNGDAILGAQLLND